MPYVKLTVMAVCNTPQPGAAPPAAAEAFASASASPVEPPDTFSIVVCFPRFHWCLRFIGVSHVACVPQRARVQYANGFARGVDEPKVGLKGARISGPADARTRARDASEE